MSAPQFKLSLTGAAPKSIRKFLTEHPEAIRFQLVRPRGTVFFAIPVMEMVYTRWSMPFMRWLVHTWQDGDALASVPPTLVHLARNDLTKMFLKTGCEWLLFIDSDVVPPPMALENLLATEKKAISGLYHMREAPYLPCWYLDPVWSEAKGRWEYESFWNPPSDTVVPIDGCGLGFFLVHRSLVEKMKPPYFRLTESAEDFGFIQRLRIESGETIWGHSGVQCFHVGSSAITTGHWLAVNAAAGENPFTQRRPDVVAEYSKFMGQDMRLAVREFDPESSLREAWGAQAPSEALVFHNTDHTVAIDYIVRDCLREWAEGLAPLQSVLQSADRVGVWGDGIASVTLALTRMAAPRWAGGVPFGRARLSAAGKAELDLSETELAGLDAALVLDWFAWLDPNQLDSFLRQLAVAVRAGGTLYWTQPRIDENYPMLHQHPDLAKRIAAQGFELKPPLGALGVAVRT